MVDEFEDLKDSDFDVIGQELEEIAELEKEFQETKDTQCAIQIARKYNSLAEVFLETEEGYTDEYYKYKKKAAEYYRAIWDATEQPNALLFASLFYECANEHGKAAECLKTIKLSKGINDVAFFLDEEVLKIVDTLINGNLKKAEKMVQTKSGALDHMVAKELHNILQFLKYKQSLKEGTQNKKGSDPISTDSQDTQSVTGKKRWKLQLKRK